ncbi:hypothetical protein OAQ99_02875 [Candidatus Kapabacteria bacterium]|nr:hypothetical protein [Candidatus Kapabacteria bacterium]
MIKVIIILIIIAPIYSFSQLRTVFKLGDCNSTIDTEKYKTLMLTDMMVTDRYDQVTVFGCDWDATKVIYKPTGFLEYNSNTFNYHDYKYHIIYNEGASSTITNNDSYLFELTNNSATEAKHILFGSSSIESIKSLSSTFRKAISDSTWGRVIDIPANFYEIYSYFVPLDSTDTYASEYTSSELLYPLFFDDGDNWLELILDSDRSNELVGFRYYSDRNSDTYTKFIKPNN